MGERKEDKLEKKRKTLGSGLAAPGRQPPVSLMEAQSASVEIRSRRGPGSSQLGSLRFFSNLSSFLSHTALAAPADLPQRRPCLPSPLR